MEQQVTQAKNSEPAELESTYSQSVRQPRQDENARAERTEHKGGTATKVTWKKALIAALVVAFLVWFILHLNGMSGTVGG